MATVKMSGGKVVTKEGKVSCTCCACCMYPRAAFGEGLEGDGTFGVADMPEKLNVNFPEGSGEWTLDASQGIYCPSGSYVLGELGYGYAESGDWVLWYPDPLGETYTSRPISPCLITGDGNLTPGDDTVEDQFSATYTVNNFFFTGYCPEYDDGSPYDNIVLERSSLCGWGPTNFEVLYKNELGEYSYVTAAMSLFFDGISGALNATGPQCSTGDISQTESPHPDPTGHYSESAIVS